MHSVKETESRWQTHLQDMDLVLEEEFLELMVHLYRNLPMGDIWQSQATPKTHASEEAAIQQNLQVCTPHRRLSDMQSWHAIKTLSENELK